MRALLAFVGSVMGSVAFQLSVALWPNHLQQCAFLVKWVWIGCGLFWLAWLLSHPWMRRHVYARAAIFPSSQFPVMPLPEPHRGKPTHNVQFVGFKHIIPDPKLPGLAFAALCFRNIEIPNQTLGEFRSARLRVDYYQESTGEEITSVFPVRWFDLDTPAISIGVIMRCAVIASCIGNDWATDYWAEVPINPALEHGFGGTEYKRAYSTLPLGRIKIAATLFGEQYLSIPRIEGILTLGEEGVAAFKQSV